MRKWSSFVEHVNHRFDGFNSAIAFPVAADECLEVRGISLFTESTLLSKISPFLRHRNLRDSRTKELHTFAIFGDIVGKYSWKMLYERMYLWSTCKHNPSRISCHPSEIHCKNKRQRQRQRHLTFVLIHTSRTHVRRVPIDHFFIFGRLKNGWSIEASSSGNTVDCWYVTCGSCRQ